MFDKVPSSYPFGKSSVSFVCEYRLPSEWENKNVSLEIQLRRYANDNWTSVVELNRSSIFRKSENTFFNFTVLSVRERQYDQQVTLRGLIQSKQCTVEPKKSPDLRCVLSDENRIIDSYERRILSIEGIC